MALDASKTRVGLTGAVYFDKTAAAPAPTSTASALNAALKDLGYVGEDGVTLSIPGAGDVTSLHAWQNGAIVRSVATPSEDLPEITLTLIETKLETVEMTFGATVTQTGTEGSFSFDTTTTRSPGALVLDVVDGSELIRVYAPQALVTEVGEITFSHEELVGYELTIQLMRSATAGYNFKTWATALKS